MSENQPTPPQPLSRCAQSLGRIVDRLPLGKYSILVRKSPGGYTIEVERNERVIRIVKEENLDEKE